MGMFYYHWHKLDEVVNPNQETEIALAREGERSPPTKASKDFMFLIGEVFLKQVGWPR